MKGRLPGTRSGTTGSRRKESGCLPWTPSRIPNRPEKRPGSSSPIKVSPSTLRQKQISSRGIFRSRDKYGGQPKTPTELFATDITVHVPRVTFVPLRGSLRQ